MIEKKNFLRKTMTTKDFIESVCCYLFVICVAKLITDANIFLIILCVTAVVYSVVQIIDALLQREDDKNEETWN